MGCNMTVVGRVVEDPELRNTTAGKSVCTVRTVWDYGWGDNKEPVFLDCIAWGKTAENAVKFLKKGRWVEAMGSLKQETWEYNGQKRSKHVMNVSNLNFLPGGKKEPAGTRQEEPSAVPF